MPKKLKDIKVTFISLVEAGANKKQIIYKSKNKDTPTWQKDIQIAKATKEGVVYGIVYSPNEVDTQGDFADAKEIKKAAYNFLKEKRVDNIDTNHNFKKQDAYVCESWIIRKNDPLFPNEKEGSWAVGIKIESKELKKAIEEGKIKALSMAGVAKVKEVKKENSFSIDTLVEALKKVFNSVNLEIRGSAYQQNLEKGDNVGKEENKEQNTQELKKEDIQEVFKEVLKEALTPIQKENQEFKKELSTLKDTVAKQQEALEKSNQQINLKKDNKQTTDSIVA